MDKDQNPSPDPTDVPTIDPDKHLKIEETEQKGSEIPQITPTQSLKIEKATKAGSDIPESNLKASLKVEEQAEGPHEEPQEKYNKKLFIFGGITLALIVLMSGGFLLSYLKNPPQEEKAVTPVASEPEPTEVPEALNRSQISFEVLNGSGVSGAAKKLADELTALGYFVIKSGNADKQTYPDTQIYISKEMEEKTEEILADLANLVKIATVSGELKDSTASARIILGKE